MSDKGRAHDGDNPVGTNSKPVLHAPGLVWGIGIAMIMVGVLIPGAVARLFGWPHAYFSEGVTRTGVLFSAVPIAGIVEFVLGIGILLRRNRSYRGAVIWKWIQVIASGGCLLGSGVVAVLLPDQSGGIIVAVLWSAAILVAVPGVPLLILLKRPSVAEAMRRRGSLRLRGVPQVPEDGSRTSTER